MSPPCLFARRTALLLSLTAAALGSCGGGSSYDGGRKRPGIPAEHLLLVTFENMRADHVSGFGYGPPTTYGVPEDTNHAARPELDFDALLDLGVGFVRAYSPSPRSHSALAGLHYGASPPAVGVFGAGDAPQAMHPSLAELLRARGMATHAFVSGASGNDFTSFSAGFETFETCAGDMATATAAWNALSEVRTQESDRPVFLWLHFSEIAPPLDPAPVVSLVSTRDFRNWFDDDPEARDREANESASDSERGDPERAGVDSEAPEVGSLEYLSNLNETGGEISDAEARRLISLYDGEVARASQVLRAFLERYAYGRSEIVDGEPLWVMGDQPGEAWRNTLLVVCGLQGLMLGDECGAWGTSEHLADATLNVPLFFHHPKSLTGRRLFDDLVELQDVAPTVLEIFRTSTPKTMEGRSLLALTDTYSPRAFEARPAFAHLGQQSFSLRTPYWRLTCDVLPSASEEQAGWLRVCEDLPLVRLYEGDSPLAKERLRNDAHPEIERRLGQRLGGRIERELGIDASRLIQGTAQR